MHNSRRTRIGTALTLVCLLACAARAADPDVLLEGFEKSDKLKLSGKAVVTQGADAVTEGAVALEMPPGGSVQIAIPVDATPAIGWLKVDTFAQTTMGGLQIGLGPLGHRTGRVNPGKDVLAMPLCLFTRSQRGGWPKLPMTVEIKNVGKATLFIDNVRLSPPAAPPGSESILLDFGGAEQMLWPGFEPAEAEANGIAWSGNTKIFSFEQPFPDPLLGDQAGAYPHHKSQEALTIRGPKAGGVAYAWITHYDYWNQPQMEYGVKINGKPMVQTRLSPAQMLSADGILEGKDQPWTPDWFQKSFVPHIVTRLEFALNPGNNVLDLSNCQVAALIVAPKSEVAAAKTYVARLEEDLERYRRQFTVTQQSRPRCEVPATDDENKSGLMLFAPPGDKLFDRNYVPAAEERATAVKLTAAAGLTCWTALVAVPCADLAGLQVTIEPPNDPNKGSFPPGACRAIPLDAVPVIRDGTVYYQPFMPARSFRALKARGVYWVLVQLAVPEKTQAGTYRGNLKFAGAAAQVSLPVEVEVSRLPAVGDEPRTFGIMARADPGDVFHALRQAMPAAQQSQAARDMLKTVFAGGFNAGGVLGPGLNLRGNADPSPLTQALGNYPPIDRPGKILIHLDQTIGGIRASSVQVGTAKYVALLRDLGQSAAAACAQVKLSDCAVWVGGSHLPAALSEIAKSAAAVKQGGARAAAGAPSSVLSSLDAAAQTEFYGALDFLMCFCNDNTVLAVGEQFRKSGPGKTFVIQQGAPDVCGLGFYAWGVGADGAYLQNMVCYQPPFNPFWFNSEALFVPNSQGGLDPTLSLLQAGAGIEDYILARRCEALVKSAKAKNIDASELDTLLTSVRVATSKQVPNFSVENFRSVAQSPDQLLKWRTDLIRAAGKLTPQVSP